MQANQPWSFLLLLSTLAATIPGVATADVSGPRVSCEVTYGGESRRMEAFPTATPLAVPTVQVGSYFLFRLVVEQQTAIKTYVYADQNSGATPLHQATYAWPPVNVGVHGFTGLHHVYEPVRDGELSFWCELQ